MKAFVVVEGGLVQYQSGDLGGPMVDVFDLDFLRSERPEEAWLEAVDTFQLMRDYPNAVVSNDRRRVAEWIVNNLHQTMWPDGVEEAARKGTQK